MSFVPYEQLRTNFARAVIIGIIGTSFFTFVGGNPMLSMAPPVVIMILYFLWFKDKTNLESQVEQFADSYYYMGFLFTLAALAISLIPWAFESSQITPENVISKLGIALLTTIIGLGGRVYLTQFLVSEEEAIADIQKRLRDGSRSLAAELDLIVENFAAVRERASDQIQEMVESGGKALKEGIDNSTKSMTKSAEGFEQGMNTVSEGLGSAAETITEYRKGVASISASTEKFKIRLEETSDLAAKYGTQFNESMNKLHGVGSRLQEYLKKLETLGETSNSINELAASFERLQAAIGKSERSFAKTSSELSATASSAIASTNEIASRSQEYDEALRESVEMIQKTQTSLTEAVKIATHKLDGE